MGTQIPDPGIQEKIEDMGKKSATLIPRTKLGKIFFGVETLLYRRGFTNPDVRFLIAVQIICTTLLILLGAALFWHVQWLLWIGLGAALAVSNFYFLGKRLQTFFPGGFSRGKIIGMLLNFYFRLFITAIFLFVFIVWLKAPISALLIGLSLSAGSAIIFGLTKLHLLKSKEV